METKENTNRMTMEKLGKGTEDTVKGTRINLQDAKNLCHDKYLEVIIVSVTYKLIDHNKFDEWAGEQIVFTLLFTLLTYK